MTIETRPADQSTAPDPNDMDVDPEAPPPDESWVKSMTNTAISQMLTALEPYVVKFGKIGLLNDQNAIQLRDHLCGVSCPSLDL